MNKKSKIKIKLSQVFEDYTKEKVSSIEPIAISGSNRKYYRIKGKKKVLIGAFNKDLKENKAFFSYTQSFYTEGLNVPKLYWFDYQSPYYLIQDLGHQSLFDLVINRMEDQKDVVIDYYKSSLIELVKFQIKGKDIIDFDSAYPRAQMDKQSFLWDLNYFKYYFLKPKNILFDEQNLENDFTTLSSLLLKADHHYFLYRDFQTRNILIKDAKPYFIDYQGGREGALQYDLASILFQVRTNLHDEIREQLLQYYLENLNKEYGIDKETFLAYYYPYVFIRLIQVMGAYGFRGLIEKRSHFIESIPYAIQTLKSILPKLTFLDKLPEIHRCINQIIGEKDIKRDSKNLKVAIKSFAYKEGIPKNNSGHGEGFVFDCRVLPNPGRQKAYQLLSGLDNEVINYLKKYQELNSFLDNVYNIVDLSINNYIDREFSILNINFGCTGGQHRSVYCSEQLRSYLTNKYNIEIELIHTQQQNWNH